MVTHRQRKSMPRKGSCKTVPAWIQLIGPFPACLARATVLAASELQQLLGFQHPESSAANAARWGGRNEHIIETWWGTCTCRLCWSAINIIETWWGACTCRLCWSAVMIWRVSAQLFDVLANESISVCVCMCVYVRMCVMGPHTHDAV